MEKEEKKRARGAIDAFESGIGLEGRREDIRKIKGLTGQKSPNLIRKKGKKSK